MAPRFLRRVPCRICGVRRLACHARPSRGCASTRYVHPDCIVLVSRLTREPRIPRRRKLLLLGLVAYLSMPFDLVPDFIPVAGQLDDVIVVALVLRHFVAAGGEPLIRELWPGPERSLALVLGLTRGL